MRKTYFFVVFLVKGRISLTYQDWAQPFTFANKLKITGPHCMYILGNGIVLQDHQVPAAVEGSPLLLRRRRVRRDQGRPGRLSLRT